MMRHLLVRSCFPLAALVVPAALDAVPCSLRVLPSVLVFVCLLIHSSVLFCCCCCCCSCCSCSAVARKGNNVSSLGLFSCSRYRLFMGPVPSSATWTTSWKNDGATPQSRRHHPTLQYSPGPTLTGDCCGCDCCCDCDRDGWATR